MINFNPYEILGISTDASAEEIKLKYKSLAQHHHPDKGGNEEQFKKIKESYEILIDPIRRKKYDTTGNVDKEKPLQDEALEILSRMFFDFSTNINPEQEDIVLKMLNQSRNLKTEAEHNITICLEYIRKLNVLLKKIRFKNQGDNFLKSFAEKQLTIRNNELFNFQRQIIVSETMVKLMENYEWGLPSNLLSSNTEKPAQIFVDHSK